MESKLPNYQPLSHSGRSKFEECPRAFSFSYLEKIPQTDNIYLWGWDFCALGY